MNVGVLALQGDFLQHVRMLNEAASILGVDVNVMLVKKSKDIERLHGLIIPGGESTTIGALMRRQNMEEAIAKAYEENNLVILGTCAGLILLARDIADRVLGETEQPRLGLLNVSVLRNAFGRQKDSFEAPVSLTDPFLKRVREINEKYNVKLPLEPLTTGIFIRAPLIKDPRDTQVIAMLQDDRVVGVMDDRIMGLAFHPELTDDVRFHAVFLDLIRSV